MFKLIKEKQEQFEKQQQKQNEKEIQKQRQFLKEQAGIFAGKTNEQEEEEKEISQKKQAFYDKLIDFLEKKQYNFQDSEYFQVNWFSIKQEILKILDHFEILKNFKLDAWKWMEKIQAITKQINQVQKEKQRKLRLDLGEESSNFTDNFESKEDLKIKEIYEKQGFFGFSICKGSQEFKNQEIRKLFSSQVIGFQEVDQEFIEKEVIENGKFDFSVFVLRGNFQFEYRKKSQIKSGFFQKLAAKQKVDLKPGKWFNFKKLEGMQVLFQKKNEEIQDQDQNQNQQQEYGKLKVYLFKNEDLVKILMEIKIEQIGYFKIIKQSFQQFLQIQNEKVAEKINQLGKFKIISRQQILYKEKSSFKKISIIIQGKVQIQKEYIPINPDVEQQNKGNLYLKEFNRQIKIAEMQEGKLLNVENFLEGKENLYQVVSLSEILVIFQLNQRRFLEILKSSYDWKEIKENIISFNKMRKKFFEERYRVNKQLLKREEESPMYKRKIEHLNSQSPLFKRNKQRVSAGFGGIQSPIINLQSFQQGIEDINKIEEEQKKQQQDQDREKFVKLQKIQKSLHGVQRERGGYLSVLKSGEFGENNQNQNMQSQSFFQAESQSSQKISEEKKQRLQRNIIGSKIMQGKLDQSVNMEKIKSQINLSDYQNNIKSKNNSLNQTQKEIENGDQEQKSFQNFQDKIRNYSRKMSQNQVFSKVNIQQQFPFVNQKFQHRNSSPFITNYQGENFLKKKMDFFLNNKQQKQKSFLVQNQQQQQQKQKVNGKSQSFSNLFLTSQGNIKTEEDGDQCQNQNQNLSQNKIQNQNLSQNKKNGEKNAQIQNMSPLNKKNNIQYNRTSILENREITEDSEENEKLEEISEIDKKFEKELIKENYKRKFQSVQISPLKISNQDFSKNQSIKSENKVKQQQQQQQQQRSPLKQRKNQGTGDKIDPFKIPNAQSEYYMQEMDDLDEIKYRSVFSNISKYRLVYQFNPDVNMRENFDKIQQKLANNLKSLGKKKENGQGVSSMYKNKQEIQNQNKNQNENVNVNENQNENNNKNEIQKQNQQVQTNLAVFQMMCLDENNKIDYDQKQDNSTNIFQNSFKQSGNDEKFSENLNQNQQNLEKILEQKQMKIDKKQIQVQNQSLNLNAQLGGISAEQRRNDQKRKEIKKKKNQFSNIIQGYQHRRLRSEHQETNGSFQSQSLEGNLQLKQERQSVIDLSKNLQQNLGIEGEKNSNKSFSLFQKFFCGYKQNKKSLHLNLNQNQNLEDKKQMRQVFYSQQGSPVRKNYNTNLNFIYNNSNNQLSQQSIENISFLNSLNSPVRNNSKNNNNNHINKNKNIQRVNQKSNQQFINQRRILKTSQNGDSQNQTQIQTHCNSININLNLNQNQNTTEIKENNSFSDLINYHETQNEDVNQECAQNQNQSYQNEEKNFNSQKILRPIFSLQNSPCNKNNENKINLKQQNNFNAPGKGFGLTLKRLNDDYKNQSQEQENTSQNQYFESKTKIELKKIIDSQNKTQPDDYKKKEEENVTKLKKLLESKQNLENFITEPKQHREEKQQYKKKKSLQFRTNSQLDFNKDNFWVNNEMRKKQFEFSQILSQNKKLAQFDLEKKQQKNVSFMNNFQKIKSQINKKQSNEKEKEKKFNAKKIIQNAYFNNSYINCSFNYTQNNNTSTNNSRNNKD